MKGNYRSFRKTFRSNLLPNLEEENWQLYFRRSWEHKLIAQSKKAYQHAKVFASINMLIQWKRAKFSGSISAFSYDYKMLLQFTSEKKTNKIILFVL